MANYEGEEEVEPNQYDFGDEEELQLVQQKKIEDSRKNRRTVIGLAACNLVSIITCACLILAIVLISLQTRNLNNALQNLQDTSLTTFSCSLLRDRLEKETIPTNSTDNIYFSSKFLADLRLEVR
jgi:hypothetical protein